MTNLEYIRTLSAEEIADVFGSGGRCGICAYWSDSNTCDSSCENGILDWLNQEHKHELKPCPFCGGKSIALERSIGTYVQCEDCRAVTDAYDTETEAIEAWNRRAK